ncbi:hypothetical protein TCAL_00257 [Tigriopus californicus]|uniref:GSKIP domain-containing protein n=1 Tax=Tigriopus californicus TaxID=6832 RepID=A0A553P3A2_TIGCA|nr:GSK3-beta interaction protein-like [Tigriopus californicus]TRY72154.1 hypothetical protein TCAL_00257 [Tigriopus californicus]|eukprot:TCALIF_00257-PA protein Name:"Similar to GSKIP GSK3-beta interaction protein (Macaca fascicularis)" AED:0.00 eAED:0.00 QI:109/1/1/1/0/0/4/1811/126
MDGERETPLDSEGWQTEAQSVIQDVRGHVQVITTSSILHCGNTRIYLNLTTQEGDRFTIELSRQGFRVVGSDHDNLSLDNAEDPAYFETPYSLLGSVSPAFSTSFGAKLCERLAQLQAKELPLNAI